MIESEPGMQFSASKMKWILTAVPVCMLLCGHPRAGQQHSPVQIFHDGRLTVQADTAELLTYQITPLYPPAGIDTAYKRSAFIHPLRTPHGQVLTRIQPPDHRHHYGLWEAWTHVLFEGDTVDFWNLHDRQGTVRFHKLLDRKDGPDYSEFKVLLDYVVFHKDGSEKTALNEIQNIRVYSPRNDRYRVDLTLTYRCAGKSPFRILEYRYAGMGWRTTEAWNKENSEVLTSAGKTRNGADGSLARWFLVQGRLGPDYGGMLVCSHPSNTNHPEPLRIWPETMLENGDLFAMFAPTKNRDWLIEPGKTYTLKYRLLIYNGHMEHGEADEVWKNYAHQHPSDSQ